MEFKYRAIDKRASNTQIPPPSSSTTLPLSHPLQHLTAINGNVSDTLTTQNALSLTLINNNDIALARQHLELKAEVVRQMMVEMEQRKMSLLRQHQYSSSPFRFSQDFNNNYMGMNPFLMMNHQQQHHRSSPAEVFDNVAAIQQLTTRPVILPLSEDIKEPVVEDMVMQTKNVNFVEKRKAETPVVADGNDSNEAPSHSAVKKSRIEWSCDLCQVITTSQQILEGHLKGKKHKNKVASLNANKIAEDESTNDDEGKKLKFWCQICRVRTNSEAMLKTHCIGKKHRAKEALLNASKPTEESNGDEEKKHKDNLAFVNAGRTLEEEEESNIEGKANLALLSPSKTPDASDNDEGKPMVALSNSSQTSEDEEESNNDEGKAKVALLNANKAPKESNNDELLVDESQKHHKFWCQMCKVGTTSEALMTKHRYGNEHMDLLRKKRGAIIVISTMPEDVQEVEKTTAKH